MVDLKWTLEEQEGTPSFELQEAVAPALGEFHTRYTGIDLSSVRTGLAPGGHLFRVRILDENGGGGAWSEPLRVEVAYMPAGRLRLLLLLGGSVVIATIGAIVHGHWSHRHDRHA